MAGCKAHEDEWRKSFNDLGEFVINEVEGTEVFSIEEASRESCLFATFFHFGRRGRDTCEQRVFISNIFQDNGSVFVHDIIRHSSQLLMPILNTQGSDDPLQERKCLRHLFIYLRYFSFYLRKSTFYLRTHSWPVFLFAIYSLYV
ncbi:hypothetical protein ASG66_20740 [Bacillus sp. Leaf406]|nr:hypothetical protein ASG66_20740 [Bacillus sp. Leaf406]